MNSKHTVEVSGGCGDSAGMHEGHVSWCQDTWQKHHYTAFIVCCGFILWLRRNALVCLQPVLRCKQVAWCVLNILKLALVTCEKGQ